MHYDDPTGIAMPDPLDMALPLANLEDSLTPFLLLGGMVLITAAFVMRLAKRRSSGGGGRGGDGAVTGAERLERLRQQDGVRGDLESLMVEIEEMAKRMGHQLDAKAVRLESLIEEADHRLTRMKYLAERLEALDPGHGGGAARSGGAGLAEVASGREAQAASEPATPDQALAKSVYALADEGVASSEIARRLDEHTGKIELILALRQT